MALKGKGRIYKQGDKVSMYFSKEVSKDSQFPLEIGDVTIEIKGKTVIISPINTGME